MKLVVAFALVLFCSGCSTVSASDAHEVMKTLEAGSSIGTGDPVLLQGILIEGCAEIPSCGGDCTKGFHGLGQLPNSEWNAIVGECSSDFRRAYKKSPVAAGDWFMKEYFASYLRKARAALQPNEQTQLDAYRDKLNIPR
jgi:hypothetical protein